MKDYLINSGGSDLGRAIVQVDMESALSVLRAVGDIIQFIEVPDNKVFAYPIEIYRGSIRWLSILDHIISNYANSFNIKLYRTDGRCVFEVKDGPNEPVLHYIFYVIKLSKNIPKIT